LIKWNPGQLTPGILVVVQAVGGSSPLAHLSNTAWSSGSTTFNTKRPTSLGVHTGSAYRVGGPIGQPADRLPAQTRKGRDPPPR